MDESTGCFEVRYVPLRGAWPTLVFPCDARGCVWLDSLPNDVRNEYFFARAAVGFGYARPTIEPRDVH